MPSSFSFQRVICLSGNSQCSRQPCFEIRDVIPPPVRTDTRNSIVKLWATLDGVRDRVNRSHRGHTLTRQGWLRGTPSAAPWGTNRRPMQGLGIGTSTRAEGAASPSVAHPFWAVGSKAPRGRLHHPQRPLRPRQSRTRKTRRRAAYAGRSCAECQLLRVRESAAARVGVCISKRLDAGPENL